jgi:hypothetical protein
VAAPFVAELPRQERSALSVFLMLIVGPLLASAAFILLPYDSVPGLWYLGMLVLGLALAETHAAVLREFFLALHVGVAKHDIVHWASTLASVFTAALFGVSLLIWGLYPLNFLALSLIYGGTAVVVPALGNMLAERRLRAAGIPASRPATPRAAAAASSEAGPAAAAAAAASSPAVVPVDSGAGLGAGAPIVQSADVYVPAEGRARGPTAADISAAASQSTSVAAFHFASYFSLGPLSAIVLVGYVAVFARAGSSGLQLLCALGIQAIVLAIKEASLNLWNKHLREEQARWVSALLAPVCCVAWSDACPCL